MGHPRMMIAASALTRATGPGYVNVMMCSVTRRGRRDPGECETQSLFYLS
jgi:hypothetical protein